MATKEERAEAFKQDIDMRLLEISAYLWGIDYDELDDSLLDRIEVEKLRAVYARGYLDALRDKGKLLKDHGYIA